jgi:hypothetical protein
LLAQATNDSKYPATDVVSEKFDSLDYKIDVEVNLHKSNLIINSVFIGKLIKCRS